MYSKNLLQVNKIFEEEKWNTWKDKYSQSHRGNISKIQTDTPLQLIRERNKEAEVTKSNVLPKLKKVGNVYKYFPDASESIEW